MYYQQSLLAINLRVSMKRDCYRMLFYPLRAPMWVKLECTFAWCNVIILFCSKQNAICDTSFWSSIHTSTGWHAMSPNNLGQSKVSLHTLEHKKWIVFWLSQPFLCLHFTNGARMESVSLLGNCKVSLLVMEYIQKAFLKDLFIYLVLTINLEYLENHNWFQFLIL